MRSATLGRLAGSSAVLLLLLMVFAAQPARMAAGPAGFDVTNEQLRGAMLTLVSSYNTLENNLERHEIRERALGEVIKKGLQTLHKGQRIFEPMRGTFSRLDERISQMETLLIARETEQRQQQQAAQAAHVQQLEWQRERAASDAAEHAKRDAQHAALLEALGALSSGVAAVAAKQAPVTKPLDNDSDDDDADGDDVGKKVDDLAESIKRLRQEVAELVADRAHADDAIKGLIAHAEQVVNARTAASEEVVDRLTERLSSFYVTAAASSPASTTTPMPSPSADIVVADQLTGIAGNVAEVLTIVRHHQRAAPDRDFMAALANDTLEAITDMRIEVLTASDKSFAKTATRIKEATATLDESLAEAVRQLSESTPAVAGQQPTTAAPSSTAAAAAAEHQAAAVEQLNAAVLHSYAELRADLAAVRQLERLALETGDNVLAVKRALEYNVHAVTSELGAVVRDQAAAAEASLTVQFGQLNGTIQALNNGALANLTAKIEVEISQVWRQIGIMFEQSKSTEEKLNRLQEQTEMYVNGTTEVMGGMGGKVSQITERMAEVDGNLNYLLGRLSLVTQEFNQIKTGLGAALDDIKNSFQTVQQKIRDVGPGPHNIAENETDYNVVNDQPQSPASAPAA